MRLQKWNSQKKKFKINTEHTIFTCLCKFINAIWSKFGDIYIYFTEIWYFKYNTFQKRNLFKKIHAIVSTNRFK